MAVLAQRYPATSHDATAHHTTPHHSTVQQARIVSEGSPFVSCPVLFSPVRPSCICLRPCYVLSSPPPSQLYARCRWRAGRIHGMPCKQPASSAYTYSSRSIHPRRPPNTEIGRHGETERLPGHLAWTLRTRTPVNRMKKRVERLAKANQGGIAGCKSVIGAVLHTRWIGHFVPATAFQLASAWQWPRAHASMVRAPCTARM